uniref:Uncharacterized protein n=1 Tax=Eutreptiella gymnastica TaxID=73025 RepID=A0A7S4FWJ9_9EUGL
MMKGTKLETRPKRRRLHKRSTSSYYACIIIGHAVQAHVTKAQRIGHAKLVHQCKISQLLCRGMGLEVDPWTWRTPNHVQRCTSCCQSKPKQRVYSATLLMVLRSSFALVVQFSTL